MSVLTETTIQPLKREQATPNNQAIFDQLNEKLSFVPNLYAAMANSENALGNFLQFSGGASSLSEQEKEVVDLSISHVNECSYCQACLLYTSPSPRDATLSRMPSSA